MNGRRWEVRASLSESPWTCCVTSEKSLALVLLLSLLPVKQRCNFHGLHEFLKTPLMCVIRFEILGLRYKS